MQITRRPRFAVTAATALAALAVLPASASALQVSITDDNGNPQPWTGTVGIKQMNPTVGFALGADEDIKYSVTFAGPDGAGTSTPISCYSINTSRPQDYRGNGTYTVTYSTFAKKDLDCKTALSTTSLQYTVNAGVSLGGPPAPRVLIRQPNSFVTQPVVLPFAGNPGTRLSEIRFALNGAIGPDGSISGPSNEAFVDPATNAVPLRITAPGRYVAVARTYSRTAGTVFGSPWTPPVTFDAVAPFDVASSITTDSRGPSYRVRIRLGEKTATGRVSFAIGRGSKGKYRSYGSAKISRTGTITKRFTLRRTGSYRMRLKFKGSATTAGGQVVSKFRITRRFVSVR
ncbi:MAG TPA: hypothetical protein VN238_01610 [Solirubrobacteraceae bacterium]|nr:hypothetical protein [Solirubrobacteraceae bacterium]